MSQLLQIFAFISAIAVAFSQYFLRGSFKIFFNGNSELYSLSSLVALIISITIMLCLFASRHYLNIKFYFSKKNKEKYYDYLNKRSQNKKNFSTQEITQQENNNEEKITEPKSFTIKQLAIFFIFLALVSFIVFIYKDSLSLRSVSYVIFVCAIVSTITTFGIQLYSENDYRQKQKNTEELIMAKIKDYFSGTIKVKTIYRDDKNWQFPTKQYLIERESKIYKVVVNPNDPDRYFTVEENQEN